HRRSFCNYGRQILLDTLCDAGVDADEIDYVEAHGQALHLDEKNPKKTERWTIVHAVSGICGLVNAIIVFENDSIPPNSKYISQFVAPPASRKGGGCNQANTPYEGIHPRHLAGIRERS
ncbi:hypothetical protein CEXT_295611, partial [Caerostris extrusa]